MRLEVWHLEGEARGRRESFFGPVVQVGSDPGADLHLEGAPGVLPEHAEIRFEGTKVYLRPTGTVRLNGQIVGEVTLQDGDLLDIGDNVHLRLRFRLEKTDQEREFQAMLARTPLPARGAHVPLSPGRLLHGRLGAAVTLLFAVILVGGAYLASRSKPRETVDSTLARERSRQDTLRMMQQRQYEKRIRTLRDEVSSLEQRMADRKEVDARVGEVQAAVAEVQSQVLERVSSEMAANADQRRELAEARDALRRIEKQDAAAQRIIEKYSHSVCLIQGSYGFGRTIEGKWHFLREAEPEMLGDDLSSDKVPLTLEGDGEIFQVEYTGTGFLVDRKGIVLTNRHIAQPWWHNDAAKPLIRDGWEPRFVHLRAYFPGRDHPFEFDLKRTVHSKSTDLAALGFTPEGELPTPFRLAPAREAAAGQRVLLLGYPSGLDALIARTEEDFARKLTDERALKPVDVLNELARRRLVRPLPTQGHISDVLDDKLLFDAPTAVGGSGGPLVDMSGRVVAINYGILKAFSGANFGVPVAHAYPLLGEEQAKLVAQKPAK